MRKGNLNISYTAEGREGRWDLRVFDDGEWKKKFNPGASEFLIFSTFLSIFHGTWLFVSVLWHGNCTEKKLDVIKYVNGFSSLFFIYIFFHRVRDRDRV